MLCKCCSSPSVHEETENLPLYEEKVDYCLVKEKKTFRRAWMVLQKLFCFVRGVRVEKCEVCGKVWIPDDEKQRIEEGLNKILGGTWVLLEKDDILLVTRK